MGENLAKNSQKQLAVVSKNPETTKIYMEPSSDLLQGGVKMKLTKIETKLTTREAEHRCVRVREK